jgi:NDP-sugar pyrophosphorylase family protein
MLNDVIIFAAGLGTRMQPITNHIPKALIEIQGRSLLMRNLDLVIKSGFKRVFVNSHHLPHKITEEVNLYKSQNKDIPEIIVTHEPDILETAGTIKFLTLKYGFDNIFSLNCDVIIQSDENFFEHMQNSFNKNKMEMMILTYNTKDTVGYTGGGDFTLNENKTLSFKNQSFNPLMGASVHYVNTNFIKNNKRDKFSLGEYYTHPDFQNKIYNHQLKGSFYHLNTVDDIETVSNKIKEVC